LTAGVEEGTSHETGSNQKERVNLNGLQCVCPASFPEKNPQKIIWFQLLEDIDSDIIGTCGSNSFPRCASLAQSLLR
jgi:hypothetical protein